MAVSLLLAGALLLSACATGPATSTAPRAIVDLSPGVGEDFALQSLGRKLVKLFGLRERTKFEHVVVEDPHYTAMSYVTLFTHGGPHHDPPSHVIKGAASSDEIPLDRFFGRARVLDFRKQPRDAPLRVSDFAEEGIAPGEIVIAVVGYNPPQDPDEYPSFPSLSGEAAEYLATLPVKAFATDMCCLVSPVELEQRLAAGLRGSENTLPEHYAFMSRGIPVIEALVNLEPLVGEEHVVFVGFPLKLKGGTGGLMRAAALVY